MTSSAFQSDGSFFRVAAAGEPSFKLLRESIPVHALPTSYGGTAPYAEFEDVFVDINTADMRKLFKCDATTGVKAVQQSEEESLAMEEFRANSNSFSGRSPKGRNIEN